MAAAGLPESKYAGGFKTGLLTTVAGMIKSLPATAMAAVVMHTINNTTAGV